MFRDSVQRMLDHVPLGRPGDGGRDRRRRAVPGRPREQLHERPHPDRGRRLDGGLHPRLLKKILVDAEAAQFAKAWDKRRQLQRKLWRIFLWHLLAMGFLLPVLSLGFILPESFLLPYAIGIATLASVPGFVLAVCILRLCFWHCPRCHFLLFTKRDKFGNAFCYSCGLRVTYSNSGDTKDVG